jgi:hypothetical protein
MNTKWKIFVGIIAIVLFVVIQQSTSFILANNFFDNFPEYDNLKCQNKVFDGYDWTFPYEDFKGYKCEERILVGCKSQIIDFYKNYGEENGYVCSYNYMSHRISCDSKNWFKPKFSILINDPPILNSPYSDTCRFDNNTFSYKVNA